MSLKKIKELLEEAAEYASYEDVNGQAGDLAKEALSLLNHIEPIPKSVFDGLRAIYTWKDWCGRESCTCRQDFARNIEQDLLKWKANNDCS